MENKNRRQEEFNARQIKKDGELYRFVGAENKMINVNILDESYKGKTVSQHLKELKETVSLIRSSEALLRKILMDNGYEIKGEDLKTLTEQISTVQIIGPDKKYLDIVVKNGYAVSKKQIEGVIILDDGTNPNIANGCYQVIDNKLVLDEAKLKRKMFNL